MFKGRRFNSDRLHVTAPDIKLVTVSYDDSNGLEVDWDGVSVYEAWAFIYWALQVIEGQLEGEPDDD